MENTTINSTNYQHNLPAAEAQADVRVMAQAYINRGWPVIPQIPGGKACRKNWTTRTFSAEDCGGKYQNIGIRLDGLVDLDLDWPEAGRITLRIAPDWSCGWGRASATGGHRLLTCTEPFDKAATKYELPAECKDDARFNTAHGLTLLEVKTSNKHKADAPPSIHASGEQIEWNGGHIGTPTPASRAEIFGRAGLIAFLAVNVRCWPTGNRHHASNALIGTLLRIGYEEAAVRDHVRLVAELANDDEAEGRVANVAGTAQKLESGAEVTGLTSLVELLGLPKSCVAKFREWLVIEEAITGNPDRNIRDKHLVDRLIDEADNEDYSDIGTEYLYLPGGKHWRRYKLPGVWEKLEGGMVHGEVSDILRAHSERLDKLAANANSEDESKELAKSAATLQSANKIGGIYSLLTKQVTILAGLEGWDADPHMYGGHKKCLHAIKGPTPALASEKITKRLGCDAAEPDVAHPKWSAYLQSTFEDLEMIQFMKRIAGYCLHGGNPEEKMFFFHGDGRNGKGVFLETLAAIFGEYAVQPASELFTRNRNSLHRSNIATLAGKRFIVVSEISVGKVWDEAFIKEFTGGNRLMVEEKYGNPFTFKPQAAPIFESNYLASFKALDTAIRERMVYVRFQNTFTGEARDTGLKKQLEAEFPAILRWMLDGVQDYLQHGLAVPDRVIADTRRMFITQNYVHQFFEDAIEISAEGREHSEVIYQAWRGWAAMHGTSVGTVQTLAAKIAELAGQYDFAFEQREAFVINGRRARGFYGIKLSPEGQRLRPATGAMML